MTSKEIRKKFLQFFKERGHTIIPSASLIPENDPSVLFTTAGMHPLVPYLLGESHPGGTRLADVQKCLRTDDIDEVGDATHLTFFEMLGNWSLGDYFKREAITWSYEFLTGREWLGISPEKLAVSVFAGDDATPRDTESVEIWMSLGIPKERITYLGKNDNWWPAGGKHSGPQGPDTEMFYWTGDETPPLYFDSNDKRWVEIWNDVFMQFNRTPEETLVPLAQKNVDTGMGLERTTAVLQNKKTIFETDLFTPIIQKLEELSGEIYESKNEVTVRMRIIADHIRAVTFILGDDFGVSPSNKDQGYIARRLLRRAIVHGLRLGISGSFLSKIVEVVISHYKDPYTELTRNRDKIISEIDHEEQKFSQTLKIGLMELEKLERMPEGEEPKIFNRVDAKKAFYIFQTFGLPLLSIQEELAQRGLMVDEKEFKKEFDEEYKKHQEISRAGSQQKFAGGLADHSAKVIHGHTATHLLHQALRTVLGEHIEQKGSNITAERLRFDFSHSKKITTDELKRLEDIVNEQIKKDLPIHFEVLDREEANARGALGFFDDKYAALGGKIKVYFVGDQKRGFFSKEICGGPHVAHTGEIGSFKIMKEEAVAAGIRRIKAVVE